MPQSRDRRRADQRAPADPERLAHSVEAEYFRYASALRLGFSLVGSPVSVQNHEPLLDALAKHDEEGAAQGMRFHFRQPIAYAEELLKKVGRSNGRGTALPVAKTTRAARARASGSPRG